MSDCGMAVPEVVAKVVYKPEFDAKSRGRSKNQVKV